MKKLLIISSFKPRFVSYLYFIKIKHHEQQIDNIDKSSNSDNSEESVDLDDSEDSDNLTNIENLEPLLEKKYFEKNLTRSGYTSRKE